MNNNIKLMTHRLHSDRYLDATSPLQISSLEVSMDIL